MHKRLKKLEEQYQDIQIPKELDGVVEKALKQQRKKSYIPKWLLGASAASLLLTAGINTSPTVAKSLAQIPGIEPLVEALTFTKYEVAEDNYQATIEVPMITGESQQIQALNEQYIQEGKTLYEEFTKTMDEVDGGYLSVDSGYIVKTDTEQLLSIGRWVVEIRGSSMETVQYTTVDKQQQLVISLPSLFTNDQYVSTISTYIQKVMREEMTATKGEKSYWIDQFTSIQPEQSFYITEQGKLVIAFDKYEVAPGYMGSVEFEIPTEIIQSLLVSDTYIK